MKALRREIAIAFAAFFAVGAFMLFVLADTLFVAQWPPDGQVVNSVATNASYLDPSTGQNVTGATLRRVQTAVLRPAIVSGTDQVLVSTSVTAPGGKNLSRQRWVGLQNTRTGRVTVSPLNTAKKSQFNASGDAVETSQQLSGMKGQLMRFPRRTPEADFVRWDPETGTAGDAVFEREQVVAGHRTLVFAQLASSRTGAHTTRSDTKLWVRPEVGAVVKSSTHITIQWADRARTETILDATFEDDADDVRSMSARVDAMVDNYRWLRVYGPLWALLASLVAVGVAFLPRSGPSSRNRVSANQS